MEKLYIPEKIKIGFQNRSGTYDGKLSYVTYFDIKGKLRKEVSFEGWRDKSIPTIEIHNKPHSGFTLNKSARRGGGYFGSSRDYVRVYDSRGFEFEISVRNLVFLLEETECKQGELAGEYVYSWSGAELVLIPTSGEDYKSCVNYTNIQTNKVAAKDLVAGMTYTTKDLHEVIYLGQHMWWRWKTDRDTKKESFVREKRHLFWDEGYYQHLRVESGVSFLAALSSNQKKDTSSITKKVHNERDELYSPTALTEKPFDITTFTYGNYTVYTRERLNPVVYIKMADGKYNGYQVWRVRTNSYWSNNNQLGYDLVHIETVSFVNGEFKREQEGIRNRYNPQRDGAKLFTPEEMNKNTFCTLEVTLQNGKTMDLQQWK